VYEVFGKIGRAASEHVAVELLKTKCLSVLLYGPEVCSLSKAQITCWIMPFLPVTGKSLMLYQTKVFVCVLKCLIVMMSIRYWQSESRSLLAVLHEWTVYCANWQPRYLTSCYYYYYYCFLCCCCCYHYVFSFCTAVSTTK